MPRASTAPPASRCLRGSAESTRTCQAKRAQRDAPEPGTHVRVMRPRAPNIVRLEAGRGRAGLRERNERDARPLVGRSWREPRLLGPLSEGQHTAVGARVEPTAGRFRTVALPSGYDHEAGRRA